LPVVEKSDFFVVFLLPEIGDVAGEEEGDHYDVLEWGRDDDALASA